MLEYFDSNFQIAGDPNSQDAVYASYATLPEADLYLAADHIRGATQATASDTQKVMRLISATRRIDLFNFIGQKTNPDDTRSKQPRTDIPDVKDNEIPVEVETATILLAGTSLINPSATSIQPSHSPLISKVKAGDAEVEYHSPTEYNNPGNTLAVADADAHNLLLKFLVGGTDSETADEFINFDNPDSFNAGHEFIRTEGF